MNFGQAIEALKQGKKVTREGWNNFMWGGEVRKATPDEVKAFMVKVFYSKPIKNY